jgi:RimJ/RimL family protein N-acetyltransferase
MTLPVLTSCTCNQPSFSGVAVYCFLVSTRGRTSLDSWPQTYACLTGTTWRLDGYELRPIQFSDRAPIRDWRNSQIGVLRQSRLLTEADQDAYFMDVVRPQLDERQPDQVLVTLWSDNQLIGYGGLVHIDWHNRRAEVSFLVDPVRLTEGSYEKDFFAYLRLIADLARDDLSLHRLTGETFPERVEHVRIFESFGFVREGHLIEHRKQGEGFADSLVHGLILGPRRAQ